MHRLRGGWARGRWLFGGSTIAWWCRGVSKPRGVVMWNHCLSGLKVWNQFWIHVRVKVWGWRWRWVLLVSGLRRVNPTLLCILQLVQWFLFLKVPFFVRILLFSTGPGKRTKNYDSFFSRITTPNRPAWFGFSYPYTFRGGQEYCLFPVCTTPHLEHCMVVERDTKWAETVERKREKEKIEKGRRSARKRRLECGDAAMRRKWYQGKAKADRAQCDVILIASDLVCLLESFFMGRLFFRWSSKVRCELNYVYLCMSTRTFLHGKTQRASAVQPYLH